MLARLVAPRHVDRVRAILDGDHLGAGPDLRAGGERRALERARHGAHAARRHLPIARPIADHVVQEAPVLAERAVVRRRERADQPVGQDDAADQVVVDRALDPLAERTLDEAAPDVRHVGEERLRLGPRGQRAEQRGSETLRGDPHVLVEIPPLRPGDVGAGQRAHRELRDGVRARDEEARVATVAPRRRVRRDLARAEVEVEAELGDQLARHQRHEVGVARDPHIHAREGPFGDGGAARLGEPLEDQDASPGTAEVGGSGQAVVAPADDDDVVRHAGTVSARRMCACHIPTGRSPASR